MAEGIARSVGGSDVAVCSAGTEPCAVDARAVKVMAEVGIDISAQRSKGVGDLPSLDFDVVIALCGDAEAGCPTLPGKPAALRWRTDDPAEVQGDEPQAMAAFRQCRDEIRRRVDDLFKLGYLRALVAVRRDAELILENISDGIIAHDMERRIFHFNRAAERITGFRREDVLNRVCPDVFPGGLCGGKCLFPEGKPSAMDLVERNVEVVMKDGERRHVVMRTRPITDDGNQVVGVLTSFRDLTREHQLERRLGEKQTGTAPQGGQSNGHRTRRDDAGLVRHDPGRGGIERAGAHSGRERNGEGARGGSDPQRGPPCGPAICPRQLRRPA